jgi:hypothetical protein
MNRSQRAQAKALDLQLILAFAMGVTATLIVIL